MQENGYEVKRGKFISLRAEGQERFTRLKAETLGERYTPEAIENRIKGKSRKAPKRDDKRIGLIIDIQNCIKAQENKGYEHWAKIQNLKQASKTLNFLTENNINSYEELEQKISEIHNGFDDTADKLKAVEKRVGEINILKKNISTYRTLKPVYDGFKKSKNKSAYEKKHKRELMLFEAAHKYLSEIQNGGKLPSLERLNTELTELTDEKNRLYDSYRKEKKTVAELDVIKANVDMLLGNSKDKTRERTEEIE